MQLGDECFPLVIEEVQEGDLTKMRSKESVETEVDNLCSDFSDYNLLNAEDDLKDEKKLEIVDTEAEELSSELVQLQAEDYGGGIALPHYGYRRPSVDYFNSNLMTYNFVIADITTGQNNVFFYDERGQGKGADALCSLRLR